MACKLSDAAAHTLCVLSLQVAFYSDVEHSIEPVTCGYRITLTYNLHAVPGAATNAKEQKLLHAADAAQTAPLYHKLRELLADPSWHPEVWCGSCCLLCWLTLQ